ncbi:hypothetical protein ERO13_D11G004200v2 [Gossypium hirsutum]|nr:hypothetical protein ERO13_D11G004200v2 [Gossypium hirsutum]
MRLKQEDIFLNNNTNNLYVSEIPVDKQKLAAPIKSVVDKFQVLPEFLKVRGLVKQHLDSFNYFVNTGIKKVVSANDRIVSHIDPAIYLRFNDVRIGNPSMTTYEKINPHTCRLADMTYAAPIFADIEYMQESHGQRTRLEKKNVVIGRMPIMLRSCRCVLYGKDEAELARLGECPLDPGGYFIINGAEKCNGNCNKHIGNNKKPNSYSDGQREDIFVTQPICEKDPYYGGHESNGDGE